jgi:Tfp pilus assembly protein PilF
MTQTPAEELFAKAVARANAGDAAGAEEDFRRCVAIDPGNALAHLNLGVLLRRRGALAEAETAARKAVGLQPSIESLTLLGELLAASGRTADAERQYQTILASVPGHAPSLGALGSLAEQRGDPAGARDLYKRAWEAKPSDSNWGIKYAIAAFNDAPAETAAAMDTMLGRAASDAEKLQILTSLLLYKEFYERIRRGLMPYHATSLDELFFKYTASDFALFRELAFKAADANPNSVQALVNKFLACFCAGDRRAAQQCLERLAPAVRGHVWETVTFDPAYYRKLETFADADLVKGLPPVIDALPVAYSSRDVAYLSCNFTYFAAFTVPMLRSIADVGPGSEVHIHLMDANETQLGEAVAFCRSLPGLTIGVTAERPNLEGKGTAVARAYYHAIRFVRYYGELKRQASNLWLMDVDALLNRDPRELYATLGDRDAAMRIRAGRFEPWNQFNACIVAASHTPASLTYFRLIAAYIADFYQRDGLRWGIDQQAMYGVFEYLRDEGRAPTLALLGARAIDYDHRDDGIVWCNSGKNKFQHLQRNPDGSLVVADPVRAKYLKKFDKYFLPAAPGNR